MSSSVLGAPEQKSESVLAAVMQSGGHKIDLSGSLFSKKSPSGPSSLGSLSASILGKRPSQPEPVVESADAPSDPVELTELDPAAPEASASGSGPTLPGFGGSGLAAAGAGLSLGPADSGDGTPTVLSPPAGAEESDAELAVDLDVAAVFHHPVGDRGAAAGDGAGGSR